MLKMRTQASVLREIDAARCVGRWSAVAPLAARLPAAESPGQAFSLIVTAEAEVEELLAAVDWDPRVHWRDEAARDGGRPTIGFPMAVPGKRRLGGIEDRLRQALKHAVTDEEDYQHKVVLAKVLFHSGDYARCRAAIESLPTTIGAPSSLSPAYARQLYMAQMVMRGLTLEADGDLAAARAAYETAIGEFRGDLSPQAAVVIPRGAEAGAGASAGAGAGASEELVNWPEEALYRRAMLALALGDRRGGQSELESYICLMDSVIPATFRAFRRLRANRLHMELVRQDIAAAGVSRELKSRLMAGHRRQIALLRALYTFPKASETHAEVLSEVDCAAADWELVGAHSPADSLRLIEILYEAVHLTYNSPRVLRPLMHALVRFGDYHEARLALGTYRVLADRQLEGVRKAIDAAVREGARGGSLGGGGSSSSGESIADMLRTAAAGARLLLVHLGDAPECLALVHFASSLIDDMAARDPEHVAVPAVPAAVKAQLALWKGAAHGLLAQKSRDPDNRADHHAAALQLLRHAAELIPGAYDAHYYLALEQALGARDIAAATASAKQAAGLDPRRVEAWHLLALLSTAQKDYSKALQICDVGMKQSEWWVVYHEIEQGAPDLDQRPEPAAAEASAAASTAGSTSPAAAARPASTEAGMAFFDLAMTRLAIEGRLRGLDVHLEAQPRLFALYGCVYGPVVRAADDMDTASSAMEGAGASTDMLTVSSLRAAGGNPLVQRKPSSSQMSGHRSLARSLVRSVLHTHARRPSHGSSHPPVSPDAPPAQDVSDHNEKDEPPKRQRSMPHLRRPSAGSAAGAGSPETPAEAYFDGLGLALGRMAGGHGPPAAGLPSCSGSSSGSARGVYYTPVPTRQAHQRAAAKRALCELWLSTAAAFAALQRPDEAAAAVAEALAACPESPAALAVRGQLELAQSRHLAALNEFHAAVSLDANDIRASVGLARTEYLLGRRDVALGLLKNITRAHGWSDPEAWYWLGRLERELAVQPPAEGAAAPAQALARALEYTAYALDLECSQPVRPFSVLRQ